jgi:hypothetical protein
LLPGGPAAKVYRLESPLAEFVLSVGFEPGSESTSGRFTVRVEGFDPGPGARFLALADDEAQATPLSPFTSTLLLGVFRARVQGLSPHLDLDQIAVPGVVLKSVSPLDASGWIRVAAFRGTAGCPLAVSRARPGRNQAYLDQTFGADHV